MKLGAMKALLADSLEGADLIFCHGGGLGWDAAQVLAPLGLRARTFDDIDSAGAGDRAGGARRRPGPGDEQRRLRRHPRQAAGGACRAACRDTRCLRHSLRQRLRVAAEAARWPRRKAAHGALMRLIYLHGFRSSSRSFKARLLQARLSAAGCGRALRRARPAGRSRTAPSRWCSETIRPVPGDTLVGSSLGGCYATWLAEQAGCKAVLLNPAVHPARDLAGQVGPQTGYHDGQPFEFRRPTSTSCAATRSRASPGPSATS